MNDHRYILQPYKGLSTRHECPNCKHKKTFTFYIDTDTNETINTNVGRCDRVDGCGYHFTPKEYFKENNISFDTVIKHTNPITKQPKVTSYIDSTLFIASLRQYEDNNFVGFLANLFGIEITERLISKYYIGSSSHWPGSSIFWQIDSKNKIRTGKVMQYNPVTGKRVKQPFNHITWVHTILKQDDFNLTQCLFGEHLLSDKTKPVAIVESEKTAIIASIYMPQFIWLATGSLTNLTAEKCEVLKGRTVLLYPDLKAFDKWSAKAKELSYITKFKVSELLENIATVEERSNGLDLADYLIRYDYKEFVQPGPFKAIVTTPEPIQTHEPEQITNELYREPERDKWDNVIDELEAFFKTSTMPVKPVQLNSFTLLTDVSFFVDSHIAIVKSQNGKKTYLPYLNRLKELKQYLTTKLN